MTQLLGTMRPLDGQRAAVRVEDVYDTDIDDLWSAITEPERLSRWLATVDGEPQLGATVYAHFTSGWEGPVRVDICERPHRLLITSEAGTEDETETEAWLTAEGGGTRLVIEERGLPLEKVHFYGAGWQAHIEDLRRSLAGDESAWPDRWTELTPVYAELSVG